jgi:hypothetical protein
MVRQIVHTFLFIILYSSTIYSQGWFWQNPLPQGNHLYDIFVFDENTAIAVGHSSTVIKPQTAEQVGIFNNMPVERQSGCIQSISQIIIRAGL